MTTKKKRRKRKNVKRKKKRPTGTRGKDTRRPERRGGLKGGGATDRK